MSPRVRFLVWVGVVVGTLVAACGRSFAARWWLGDPQWSLPIATTANLAGVGAMIWLLLTTPPEAIKLNRWVSVALISAGAGVILQSRVWAILPPWEAPGTPIEALGHQAFLLTMNASVSGPIAILFAWRWRHRWGRLIGSPSPWWAIVLFWSPAVVPVSTSIGVRLGSFPWGGVVFIITSVAAFAAAGLGHFGIRSTAWVWITFALVCIGSLASDLMAIIAPL